MNIKVKPLVMWGLFLAIIASENFFYLIGASSTVLKDFFLLLTFIWILFVLYVYRSHPNPKYHFKWLILFSLILSLTSSFQSYLLYGQNLMLGIRPQRYWIVWGLMYFPLVKLLYLQKISHKQIVRFIFFTGTIEILLYIGQYLLQGKVIFLNVGSNTTYSNTRFYVSNLFLNLLLFINLEYLFKRTKMVRSIIYIFLILFVIIIVGKMRMTFIAVSLSIIIGVLIWKKGSWIKGLAIGLIIIFAIFSLNLEEVKSIFETLNGQSKINTLGIREIGREFYLNTIMNNPFLGGGYINTQWKPAALAARVDEGIYWVDNGIFGFMYFYGLLGFIWVMFLFGKIFRMGNKLKNSLNYSMFFIMPIYWCVAMVTELHWYYNSFLVMTLFLCMLDSRYGELKKNTMATEERRL